MFLKLIWKLDKWAHLAGAFMLTTIAVRVLDIHTQDGPYDAIALMVVGSIALEAYQWQYQPRYVGKEADTVLDLIADGIGIGLAVVI